MRTTGRLHTVTQTLDGQIIVSFICNASPHLDDLGGELDITVQRHREPRSRSANSYFHVLVTKIAEAVGASNTEVKNRLIREYGAFQFEDGRIPTYGVKAEYAEAVLNYESVHFKPVGLDGDYVRMAIMRGSHTYNTKEMARLIDGTVSEARELGIETLTPNELERMKANWSSKEENA